MALRRGQTKVQVGTIGCHTPGTGTHHKALLDQKGLQHILNGAAFLAYRRRQIVHPDRATIEFLDNRQQQFAIQHVEAVDIHIQHIQCPLGHLGTDLAIGLDLGIVTHPA